MLGLMYLLHCHDQFISPSPTAPLIYSIDREHYQRISFVCGVSSCLGESTDNHNSNEIEGPTFCIKAFKYSFQFPCIRYDRTPYDVPNKLSCGHHHRFARSSCLIILMPRFHIVPRHPHARSSVSLQITHPMRISHAVNRTSSAWTSNLVGRCFPRRPSTCRNIYC
jgi:hypothetical protein